MLRTGGLLQVCLLVLVAVVTTSVADENKMLQKYGLIKIFDSCFGKEETKKYMAKKHAAKESCRRQPVRSIYSGSSSSPASLGLRTSGAPVNSPMNLQGFDFSNFFSAQGSTQFIPVPVFVRQKREYDPNYKYFSDDRVRSLVQKVEAKISNATCVMREFNYMDDNNDILYDNMISDVRGKTSLDLGLKQDLVEAIEECRDYVSCLPSKSKAIPMPPALLRFKKFKKCNMKKKIVSCMKKDLRAKRNQFDLTALEDFADIDDDDKMLGLIWGQMMAGEGDF